LKWVAASGVKGLSSVTLTLAERTGEAHPYTVRLYFAEDESLGAGDRVFDVSIQWQRVLKDFDILAEAGAPNRTLVKEFRNIPVDGNLTVAFTPGGSAPESEPVICGIEVAAEGW